ncbi:MAG: YhdP family protein [Pseudomonadota bacterium]
MLNIAKYLHGKFWLLVSWLVICTAIILTLFRLFLPLIDLTPYKDEIARIAEEAAGMPLHIGSMHIELHRAHLALRFSDISLLDTETGLARLHFREAHADIRLLASLINRRLTFGGAMVSGANLRVIRRWDGSFMVNGFQESSAGEPGSVAGFFLRGTRLRVHDSVVYWLDEKSRMPALRFTKVNVDLLNQDHRHQLVASMRLGEDEDESVQLIADLQEGIDDPMGLNGQAYLKTSSVELAGRLGQKVTQGLDVSRGQVDLELWGEISQGRLSRMVGKAKLTDIKLSAARQQLMELDRLSTLLTWKAEERGWRLDLDQLILVRKRQLWPPGRLYIARQTDDDGSASLQLGADYVGLQELSQIVVLLLPQESKMREVLAGLSPAGHLTSFRLAFDQKMAAEDQWQVSGSVTQFKNQAWKSVPGLSGLRLKFEGDQQGGTLLLGSEGFIIEMPGLFRGKLSANKLDGSFKWRYSAEQGLSLSTSDLHVVTEHIQTLSRLGLQIPLTDETPVIDMQTNFWDGDGAQKSRYLPVGIMPGALVDWLDRSIVGGHIKSGSMLLHGPLEAFPYNNHEGRFEVLFGIEKMVLDYMQEWPRLEEVVAEAHFLNNSLRIKLSEGMMLGTELLNAQADIRRLSDASPVEIKGALRGPVSDLFRVLSETPLKGQFEKFTREVAGAGRARTSLDLRIPLRSRDSWKINGKVDFQTAALMIKEHDLKIENLIGRLEFDDQKVWGEKIHGRLLGQQVDFQISPQIQNGNKQTRVSTRLKTPLEWLQKRAPILEILEGDVPARVDLDIAHTEVETPVRLSIHSDLKGTAVNLPAPLGKRPEEVRETKVVIDFQSDRKSELRIEYAGLLQALLSDLGDGYNRGDLRFGAGPVELADKPGIRLHGETQNLDLDHWVVWLDQRNKMLDSSAQVPFEIDLLVADLMLAGITCASVKVEVGSKTGGWQVKFDSDDISGSLTLPGNLDRFPVDIHLKQLKLKTADFAPASDQNKESREIRDKDPSTMPALNLKVDALLVDDKPLGQAILKWRRAPLGIHLTQLTIGGGPIDLQGQGFWHLVNGRHLTHLDLQGRVESLGQLQEEFDLQLGIDEAPMNFDARLEWPLPPYALNLNELEGALEVKVEAGEITEVDPGMGRLVGLFSLHALGKRLLLDFSDLFAKGLKFDHIEGSFELRGGDAHTSNLEMVGPAVKVDVMGRTGLASQDYDQLVTVTPRVSSTLPIVGALAINPTVGVVLAVAQQLLGKQMDRITQTEYQLTGTWEQPEIKELVSESPETDLSNDLLDLD